MSATLFQSICRSRRAIMVSDLMKGEQLKTAALNAGISNASASIVASNLGITRMYVTKGEREMLLNLRGNVS